MISSHLLIVVIHKRRYFGFRCPCPLPRNGFGLKPIFGPKSSDPSRSKWNQVCVTSGGDPAGDLVAGCSWVITQLQQLDVGTSKYIDVVLSKQLDTFGTNVPQQ